MVGFGLGLSLRLVVILSVMNKEGLRVVASSFGRLGLSVFSGLVVSATEGLLLDSTLGRVEYVKLGLIVISAEGFSEGHIVLGVAEGLLLGADEGISVSTMLGLTLGF